MNTDANTITEKANATERPASKTEAVPEKHKTNKGRQDGGEGNVEGDRQAE